jgi:alkylated DNA repair dioxygenase AlkB
MSDIIHLQEGNSWVEIRTLPEELKCDQSTFQELLDLRPAERGKVIVFGKEYDVPRTQQSYNRDYSFSGLTHKATPLPSNYLTKLKEWVSTQNTYNYEQVLINWYLNGEEYIGPHSDDEKELVAGAPIYSFSFGATRDFVIKSKKTTERYVIPMDHGSVIIMCGAMQKYYKHSVPKRLKVKEPRINVTVRAFKIDN